MWILLCISRKHVHIVFALNSPERCAPVIDRFGMAELPKKKTLRTRRVQYLPFSEP